VQLIDVVKELSGRIEVMEKKQVSSLCYNLMKSLASVILSHAILNLWKCYMPNKLKKKPRNYTLNRCVDNLA
jgi:hypothetical protein